ncbi:MAG: PEP-CTERM sorting domain-containing protein [Deltaproteobacteria bacterium]|nr:PEP-CTERM sorting domain-containing protein [Deltaproteobacteria bacterium]
MRKFLLGLVCSLVVVGVANMGHAFLFFGGGGGGHKKSSGASSLNAGSLFNYDFHQFGVDPKPGDPDPNYFNNFPNHPDLGSNQNDGGLNLNFDSDFNHTGDGGSEGYTAQNGASVPEPATLILLGMGLAGLAAFGRSKFKK